MRGNVSLGMCISIASHLVMNQSVDTASHRNDLHASSFFIRTPLKPLHWLLFWLLKGLAQGWSHSSDPQGEDKGGAICLILKGGDSRWSHSFHPQGWGLKVEPFILILELGDLFAILRNASILQKQGVGSGV